MSPDRPPPRLEAMSLGLILDRAFQLYTGDFPRLAGIAALPALASYLVQQAVRALAAAGPPPLPALLGLPGLLLQLLLHTFAGAAVTAAAAARYQHRRLSIRQACSAAFHRLGTLSAAWLVAGLLIVLGMIPLFVLGVIIALSSSLITPVVMLEEVKAGQSRRRSRELMKGFRWKLLGLFALFGTAYLLLLLALVAVGGLFGAEGGMDRFSAPWMQVALQLVSILGQPLTSLVILLVYYNQRIRKEGYDLVLLAQETAAG